jgi:flagellar biosynthesis protein FlhB
MADQDNDSKTEQATDKHLSEAHGQGQFAKAPEISVVLMLLATLGTVALSVGTASRELGAFASNVFSNLASMKGTLSTVPVQFGDGMLVIGKVLLPVLSGAVVASLIAGGVQSGFRLTPEVIGLKFEALNPVTGMQRIFSKQVFVHAVVDCAKMVAIGFLLWGAARAMFEDAMFTTPVETEYLGRFFEHATYAFLSKVALALGVVAAASYGFEFFRMKKQLMMTREQVKEERKQSEGDGHVKGAMRRMARRLMQRQMLKAVPMADVVVTNPTHFAVALKYERGRDQAPVILAKGEDQFARRIKALAAEHGVPMVENKPVARMLFAVGEVGKPIPSQLYEAVAGILAFVYRTHRYYFYRLRARRAEAAATTRLAA